VVIGITGTGGAGKSSLTDELVRRLLQLYPDLSIAVLSIDPTRRRTGGALLGDRIRMNTAGHPRVFMRSMATREANRSMSAAANDAIRALRAVGFPLILVETAGIGQGGSEIVEVCDIPVYVMTPEYGAPSQLEKIDMLDWAQVVAINKADRFGAEDAQRYVARQMIRNRQAFNLQPSDMPVYLCCANRFADAGVDALANHLADLFEQRLSTLTRNPLSRVPAAPQTILPARRTRYLSEISDAVRTWRRRGEQQVEVVFRADGIRRAAAELGFAGQMVWGEASADAASSSPVLEILVQRWNELQRELDPVAARLLNETPALLNSFSATENVYEVRGKQIRVQNYTESLSGTGIAKVAVPRTAEASELLRWRWFGNVPGEFPYTTGVFPYKRVGEDPTRMFAGEGMPERTNRRFHYLSKGQPAIRLSTAFDSVTLYGRDPAPRPDVWGKVGNSGVSVCTVDDAKRLYSGFDLVAPSTSVSMTINGPAPAILAMYFNTAIDQAVERRLKATDRWEAAQTRIAELVGSAVTYRGELPPTHDGGGLGLLGVSGDQLLDADEYESIRAEVLSQVRGTVQADILKEDQAQNTCIFSTEFALRMMGDIQEYFNQRDIRNFYSVSISGYHIAEAGANPITQLAFTLANGFTFVEYYRSRGMDVDLFARNLSFFFSNGIDPEYTVIGRVARRIWAVTMRDLYGANPRSQQLKYHIQTSGRSLHAQEIDFNDIRTTLQAFYAIADNCNSLHTNAYDEAITTPTEESVRRAVAIQLILNREFGMLKNENPLQGAYFVEQLTDLVEEAVLAEFDRISDRGGVLGAMELMYQRSRIQEESMIYEHRKHSGEMPIIGVNTFLNPNAGDGVVEIELVRAGDDEKQAQLDDLKAFQMRNEARSAAALQKLQDVALAGGNIFAELMETVKSCSLGQITDALFMVGGQYRRNM
jgi:isobutyryl-CoA mutase